jgi:hypothetical protein
VQNNPAVRLYDLTRRLRSTSGSGSPARSWAQALSIPINDEMTGLPLIPVVQGILAFLDLLNETETGIRELEFDDFYSEAFPPLRRVVQVSLSNLRANQSNLTRPITDETLTLLRVIASEWEKKKQDPKIDEEVLKEIQIRARGLFEAIKRAEINRDLKRLILSLNFEMEQAIQQYRIGGPEGLMESVDKGKASQRTKIWWAKFCKVAAKFSKIIRLAGDTQKMIHVISRFVRLVSGAPDQISPVDVDHPGKP